MPAIPALPGTHPLGAVLADLAFVSCPLEQRPESSMTVNFGEGSRLPLQHRLLFLQSGNFLVLTFRLHF
jgi:hypothetical protein